MPVGRTLSKSEVIGSLNFGERIAEDERDALSEYFVETDQWRRVISGQVDVIFGPKGSGKSAIYTGIVSRENELADRNILLLSAENPRGSTVFQGLIADPPTSEVEFVSIWKLYVLTLVGALMSDYGFVGSEADHVVTVLRSEGVLMDEDTSLAARFGRVWDRVKKIAGRATTEAQANFDPSGNLVSLSAKLSLREPTPEARTSGVVSLDDLLAEANRALELNGYGVWLLFDRLDVAFAESHKLEAHGLRALFRTYLDMGNLDNISLKIFLRTDIWAEITADGFREASHITKQLRISWGPASLLNLVVKRALKNADLVAFYSADPTSVLDSSEAQRVFFDLIVPEKVDAGKNPKTFEWILGRVQDGKKQPAPREVIHLLTEARDAQQAMLERGESDPPGTEVLSRGALREALDPVSTVRLEQTFYAEYPSEKPWVQALDGARTEYTVDALSELWEVAAAEAQTRAQRLVDIGFLERRMEKDTFWVPFLYRPALHLKQGAAW